MSSTKFCTKCGGSLKETDKLCANCGVTIEETPVKAEESVQQEGVATPASKYNPPTKEEKNKLILWMVLSIIIPIIGIVLGIVMYSKKDKTSGMHYLLCGFSSIAFASGAYYWAGFIIGALLISSAIYNGLRQINSEEIKLP